jgi:predicted SprT family Zn-dependent metalloprotease
MTENQMDLFVLKSRVGARLIRLKSRAKEMFPVLTTNKLFDKIKVEFTNDLGDAMAKAWMSLNVIEVEIESLVSHTERVISEVLGHELCHLMVPMIYKGVGYKDEELHGLEWQTIMNEMGFAIDLIDLVS